MPPTALRSIADKKKEPVWKAPAFLRVFRFLRDDQRPHTEVYRPFQSCTTPQSGLAGTKAVAVGASAPFAGVSTRKGNVAIWVAIWNGNARMPNGPLTNPGLATYPGVVVTYPGLVVTYPGLGAT
jgi:hypothetical protein